MCARLETKAGIDFDLGKKNTIIEGKPVSATVSRGT
jgi:hypothetical protein